MEVLEAVRIEDAEKVSHSEAGQFTRCEWQHLYYSGLGLEPVNRSDPLRYGVLGHDTLKAYYTVLRDGGSWEEAVAAGNEALEATTVRTKDYKAGALVQERFDAYVEFYKDCNWEILEVEKYYEVMLPNGIVFNFQIDLLVRVGRMIYIVDHKWKSNFTSEVGLLMHTQLAKYIWALRQKGINVNNGILNQIRYASSARPDNLFKRSPVRWTDREIATFVTEQAKISDRIERRRAIPVRLWRDVAVRTQNEDVCNRCDFIKLCRQEAAGTDATTTMITFYRARDLTYREQRNDPSLDPTIRDIREG